MTGSLNTFTNTLSSTLSVNDDWLKHSQSDLFAAIARIRFVLEQTIAAKKGEPLEEQVRSTSQQQPVDSYLTALCASLGLSEFERDILLLCVGLEMSPSWGDLCAEIANDPKQTYVTFGLAMSVLDQADWSAFSPAANLRRWHLVEIGAGNALTASPLRVDERILHYLMGDQHLDQRLLRLLEPIIANPVQIDSHQQVSNQAIATSGSERKCGY